MDKKEKEEKQKFYVVGYGKAEKVSEEVFKKEMAEEKEKKQIHILKYFSKLKPW